MDTALTLQDPLSGFCSAVLTAVNKKDFACTEDHMHLQHLQHFLSSSLILVEPSMPLGMEVPGGADAALQIVGIYLLTGGAIMVRAMAKGYRSLESDW